jgi:hypothetical protein
LRDTTERICRRFRVGELRLDEPEVGDAPVAIGIDENVLRLEVAVHKALQKQMPDAEHSLRRVQLRSRFSQHNLLQPPKKFAHRNIINPEISV